MKQLLTIKLTEEKMLKVMLKKYMRKLITSLVVLFVLGSLCAQQKRIYLAPDDHTDYMWTATEEEYRRAFLEMLDFYIELNEKTASNPYHSQSKWNCDGSFWVYTYEKNRSKAQFDKLIEQIRNGKITVPLNTLVGLHGMAPVELIIREMYYAGSLERRFGLNFDMAINMEDQVLPLGLSSIWAGSGAKYSWKGVCACATRVKSDFTSRPHEVYWYQGLDGQKILMKWYSLVINNMHLGGYAEARDPLMAITQCKHLMESPKYPYSISGAFGKGWDDLKTLTDEFVEVAISQSDEEYQVIVSNQVDFFEDFEQKYGASLPAETLSYGSTEWGISVASMAEVSASVKRSIEKLRAAEAMYLLVALKEPGFASDLNDIREKAWIACGLYFEHDWTADGPITRKQRADWQRKIASQLNSYVDILYESSLDRLSGLIARPAKNREFFFVFNPLSWSRTDYCDYPYNGSASIAVRDITAFKEVPFQFITKKDQNYLRILASDIPSVGYKIFEIQKRDVVNPFRVAAKVNENVFENDFYRISFNERGVITSLIDKKENKEWISPVNKRYANDLGSGTEISNLSDLPLKIENEGPVSVTLVAESYKPLKHISKITLFENNDRIELENFITQNFGAGPVTYSFSFNIQSPDIWHEEAGAILLAKPASKGGHYADSLCRLDWLAINHFADISGNGEGMMLSNRDAYFMKPGQSIPESIDYNTPQINVLAGGQIDRDKGLGIENQDGDSYFENFFALKPYNHNFDATASMKFSLEHQNPLIAGTVTGAKSGYGSHFSLLSVSDPNVLLWSVKPSEEGIENGIIARFWNFKNEPVNPVIRLNTPIERAWQTTHIETNLKELGPVDGTLPVFINQNQIITFRLMPGSLYSGRPGFTSGLE
jgi:alpha-mannosidase